MKTQLDIFYNTLDLPESELKVRQLKAGTQNAKILQYFKEFPDESFTPYDVWFQIHDHFRPEPITSIRRAMTTLTKLGYLEKTTMKKKGEYDMDNYCWKLWKLRC